MDRKFSLLFGIIGGILLWALNIDFVLRLFDMPGVIWYILHGLSTVLGIIGILSIIIFSLALIIDAFKIFKKGN